MTRRGVCAIAVVLIWVCAFAWVSGLDWRTPFTAREHVVLSAGDFYIVTGTGTAGARGLTIDGPGSDGGALQIAGIGGQKSPEEHARLAPDEDLAFTASRTRVWLSAQPYGQRVFVAADTAYEYFRLIYLLLPRNAAALFYVGDAVLPHGEDKQWKYYPELGLLNGRDKSHLVGPAFTDSGVRIFRVTGEKP